MNAGFAVAALAVLALAPGSASAGSFEVWGTDLFAQQGPPSGDFLILADGGAVQTVALRTDGTVYLSPRPAANTDLVPPVPDQLVGRSFVGVAMARNHAMVINADGGIEAWGSVLSAYDPIPAGKYVAATGSAFFSAAIDVYGDVVLWGAGFPPADYAAIIGVGGPQDKFTAIGARGRYIIALSEDGIIYGWGVDPGTLNGQQTQGAFTTWASDQHGHFSAPGVAGNPYTAIAAGLDHVEALRADGSVVIWKAPANKIPDPPAGIVFTKIAAGARFGAGIDQAGHIHVWADPTLAGAGPLSTVPPGCYSDISAATQHISAIHAVPLVTVLDPEPASIWPPNHEMITVALTFRADDACSSSPVAPSGLSVTLRSNQPDTGGGSGNTTGDTNGLDGYTSAVALPPTAIVQNGDGSYTATFQVRAERAGTSREPRVYTVSVQATDGAIRPNTSAPVLARIVVALREP